MTLPSNLNPKPLLAKTACGGTLQDPSLYPCAMFNGEKVYFCNEACLKAFKENPAAFMTGEIEHPSNNDEKQ
jgi:YHS domain-containing protein